MKTLIIIETAEELLQYANRDRLNGDPSPRLPEGARLVFDNDYNDVKIEADGFVLGNEVSGEDVIRALIANAGLKPWLT